MSEEPFWKSVTESRLRVDGDIEIGLVKWKDRKHIALFIQDDKCVSALAYFTSESKAQRFAEAFGLGWKGLKDVD